MGEARSEKVGMGITSRTDPNFLELDVYAKANEHFSKVKVQNRGPPLERGFISFYQGFGVGAICGMAQAAWYPDVIESADKQMKNIKWAKTDTFGALRTAVLPALFVGTAAGLYSFGEATSEMLRGVDDSTNALYGGGLAGLFLGGASRRPNIAFASSLLIGTSMFLLKFSGDIFGQREEHTRKMFSELPRQHVESDELKALKDKYPKFQNM